MQRFFRTLIGALVMCTAGIAQAGDNPIVVELYTSQGCSSCPPADALLEKLAGRDDVIALALHVDYWDYIGWKDNFADPAFTIRQKAYARAAGTRRIYTPQMIVGGRDHVIGNRPMELADAINAQRSVAVPVDLEIQRTGNRMTVHAVPLAGASVPKRMVLQLVRFEPEQSVAIKRGENAGRTISYSNIVTSWQQIGKWNGKGSLDVSVDLKSDGPIAVILQAANNGPVIAAAQLR